MRSPETRDARDPVRITGHAALPCTIMKIIRSKTFTAARPWGALDIASMRGITTRLPWTDQPYKWHVNDGEDVFAVLDGRVEMRYREPGIEQSAGLGPGHVSHASMGTQ